MNNQNFSILSNFPKVIIFLQPPYERNCQKIKEDLTYFCKEKNFNLIEIIESEDSYDQEALHRLIELVNNNASNTATITVIIDHNMIATPNNSIFWAVVGTLTGIGLITVTAFDYDYIDHEGIFLDDSNLNMSLLDTATRYFKKYYALNWNKKQNKSIEQLISKPILFLQPPYNLESRQLREEIAAYCEQKGYGILKTIKSNGSFDHHSFCELVRRAAIWQKKPVMVIIDQLMLHTSINKIFWAVLGTLRTAGLITISTYARVNNEVVLRQLNKHDNRFIHEATIYAKKFEIYERAS